MATAAQPSRTIDRAQQRAVRQACRAAWPDLFFAAHLLPIRQRVALHSVATVTHQLHQILTPPGSSTPGTTPGSSRSPAPTPGSHQTGCAGESRDGDSAIDVGGCGAVGCCGGSGEGGCESLEQRRAVCVAVLDHLLAGKPTGKLELDGFAHVAETFSLDRRWFDELVAGEAELMGLPRVASWRRLSDMLERSAGSLAKIVARILGVDEQDLHPPAGAQLVAWASGIAMTRLLPRIGDDWLAGRLRLPLDDLVAADVSEADLARYTQGLPIDDRWIVLMHAQTQRTRKLIAGGTQWLAALADPRARRSVIVFTALHEAILDRIDAVGGDVFTHRFELDFWSRLRCLKAGLAVGRA